MGSRQIKDLWFKSTEENMLGEDRRVEDTPHYRSAVAYYNGDGGLREYCEWQLRRGKNVFVKKEKFKRLLDSAKVKGIRVPIELGGDYIIHGHHRAAVALALGAERIRCC